MASFDHYTAKTREVHAKQWTGDNEADFPGAKKGADETLNIPAGSPNQALVVVPKNCWVLVFADGGIVVQTDEEFQANWQAEAVTP